LDACFGQCVYIRRQVDDASQFLHCLDDVQPVISAVLITLATHLLHHRARPLFRLFTMKLYEKVSESVDD